MSRKRSRILRWVSLTALTLPLFQNSTCIDMAERVVVNSFFNAVIPVLDEQLKERLTPEESAEQP